MSKLIKIDEQENVKNSKAKNILVTASAGSGKTTMMVRLIIDSILSGEVEVKDLLVLSFTNASAQDMLEQIEKELLLHAEQNPKIREQVDMLSCADICTIHSFCVKLARTYFYEANISSRFTVAEEEKANAIKQKTIKKIIREFKEKSPEKYLELCEKYSNGKDESGIVQIIYQIENSLSTIPEKEKWLKTIGLSLFTKEKIIEIKNAINSEIIDYFSNKLKLFNKLFEKYKKLDLIKYQKLANEYIFDASEFLKNKTFEKNYELLKTEFIRTAIKDNDISFLEIKTELQKCAKEYSAGRKNLAEQLDFIMSDDFGSSQIKDDLTALIEIEQDYELQYNHEKQKQALLDFNDLEKTVLYLLKNEEICKDISEKYKCVYVDEFQDTNTVQDYIIKKIAKNAKRAVFGDLKQAIYGFRNSNPEIIQELQTEYDADKSIGEALPLNTNFRSAKNILSFINLVFSKIMTKKVGGVDYQEKAQLKTIHNFPEKTYSTKLCLFDEQKTKTEIISKGVYDIKKHNKIFVSDETVSGVEGMAQIVSNEIKRLVASGKIFKPKSNVIKPITFSDIAILVRSRTSVVELCEVLKSCQIPTTEDVGRPICGYSEIRTLISFFQCAVNFEDEISLMSALTSCLINLTFDEIMEIKNAGDKSEKLINLLKNYQNNEKISKKINKFENIINKIIYLSKYFGINSALSYLVFECDYLNSYFYANGKDNNVCLRLNYFCELIKNKNYLSITDFLNYISSNQDNLTMHNLSDGEIDAVKISTIHASKGLEFPVVFLFDASRDFLRRNDQGKLQANDKFGFSLPSFDENNGKHQSLQSYYIKNHNRKREFEEEIRLLYVALTRAQNHLFIIGECPKQKIQHFSCERDVMNAKSFTELILSSLEEKELALVNEKQDFKYLNGDVSFNFAVFTQDKEKGSLRNASRDRMQKTDMDTSILLSNWLSKIYPNEKATLIAKKNTVSELAFNDETKVSYGILEKSNILNTSSDSAEAGTNAHLLFESVDFKNDSLDDLEKKYNEFGEVSFSKQTFIDCVYAVKDIVKDASRLYKEKEFIMQISLRDLGESIDEQVVVQGKLDLLAIGEKNIIIDYKLTSQKNKSKLIEKYKKQIMLYKIATQKAFDLKNISCYILSINSAELIQII